MKKINFFINLKKKGKIQIIEPSEDVKKSYLKKSESNLASAKILLKNDKLEESIGLAYYSMYNLLTALLFKTGIKCENHAASIILLKELFRQENKDISEAKTERIDKQYYADFKITKKDVEETLKKAEEFNSKITDFISKMNSQEITLFRESFKEILGEKEENNKNEDNNKNP